MNDKIKGALVGAAAGDAMASATDGKSYGEIVDLYGGPVRDFIKPDRDTFSGDREAAQFTDAFSIPYFLIKGIIENGGRIDRQLGVDTLRAWGGSEYFRFAGMTTKKVVNALNETTTNDMWAYSGHLGNKLFKGHYYALSSNGSACKAFPLGLINPENPERAIKDAIEITMTSHDDPLSLSGAGAVAAAVAECFSPNATVFSVVQTAIRAADEAKAIGDKTDDIWDYPGPSTARRLEYAQQIAVKFGKNAATELKDIIGCGPEVAETVPTALGLVIAHKEEPLEAFFDAVNLGDETCALAAVTGAIIGALHGSGIFPESWERVINEANGTDLGETAEDLTAIAEQRMKDAHCV